LSEQAEEDLESVTLNSNGDPVYDEEKHGPYDVTVKKLDQNGRPVAKIDTNGVEVKIDENGVEVPPAYFSENRWELLEPFTDE